MLDQLIVCFFCFFRSCATHTHSNYYYYHAYTSLPLIIVEGKSSFEHWFDDIKAGAVVNHKHLPIVFPIKDRSDNKIHDEL
jgi:hypothetical protein